MLTIRFAHEVLSVDAKDQPWSAQDEVQIRGRVHRQGQALPCTSYQLLALGTADVVVSDISDSKSVMLDAFFSRDVSKSK